MKTAPAHFAQCHPNAGDNLRFTHPERATAEFNEGKNTKIVFSSDFDGGNMSRCCKGNQKNEYLLWISNDCAPYRDEGYRTWFYFSVKGVPQGEQLTFTFKNLNDQRQLYGNGLKPVFRSVPNS